ncbi:MAG: hypothetical protein DLM59_18945 [Pseudonocardiales bacterium]|nr:MAG: hypothetical protein DLM59_18945 [Pseudonocardiales bacterium]
MSVVLLGPQRKPSVGPVVRSMDLPGRVATITAGWQEREPDDAELDQQLGAPGLNLSLYARWLDVLERDPEFATAERRLRALLDEVQEVYLVRLDHALRAVYAIARRGGNVLLQADALTEAIAAVREVDTRHLRRISDIHEEYYTTCPPHERPVIAEHRAAVAQRLHDTSALVITGGHVGVLVATLHLFNVAAALRSPVIAWSAGAMALTDRVVLFHDRAAQGPGHPELYGSGLSLLRGVVALPHAGARLLLADSTRMAVFARRFAPARCIPLEAGGRVDVNGDTLPPGTRVLGEDGRVRVLEAA